MKDIEKGQNLEITVNELVEEYSQLLTENTVNSFRKQGKLAGNTKKFVITQLENKFESVEYISGAGRRKAKFTLNNYNGSKEVYKRENKGGRPSLDWSNEELVIHELINQEVAFGKYFKDNDDENYKYNGFTITKIFDNMLNFSDSKIKELIEYEVKENINLALSKQNDKLGLRNAINYLMRNQRGRYTQLIKDVISTSCFKVLYFDSKNGQITVEQYMEYLEFKQIITKEIYDKNNENKKIREKNYQAGLSLKDSPKALTNLELNKKVEDKVNEKFDFKYAYESFIVFEEIEIDGMGNINKVRENFFNRVMKNIESSQDRVERTDKVDLNENIFYRLTKSGQYVNVMESIFSQLLGIEIESKKVDVVDNSVKEDDEALQEHLFNVQQYESVQEEHDYFYNQDDYVDVERILYEMENTLSDEEYEERYNQMVNDIYWGVENRRINIKKYSKKWKMDWRRN